MSSLVNISRKTLITASVIAISCGVTYYADEKRNETRIADLEDQVDSLNNKVLQARVDQRISSQMETIADQQSQISDLERKKAEEQRRIADIERNKAKIDEELARKSQAEAVISAKEAKQAQKEAEIQSQRATENMLIAQQALAHADTLRYLALANSLAETSINQYNNYNWELARLLSYASWHYNQLYGGDAASNQAIYKALLNTAHTSSSNINTANGKIDIQGNVRKVHVLPDGTVGGVTDYGDIFFLRDSVVTTDNIEKCNFRDFYTYGMKRSLALCADGRVIEYEILDVPMGANEKDIKYSTVLTLPVGFWKRLIGLDHGNTLVAMSDNKLVWIDSKTMTVTATADIPNQGFATCIGKQGQTMLVFCANHNPYISTRPGELIAYEAATGSIESDKYGDVTAYIYNKEKKLHFLGLYSGKILVCDDKGKIINELIGHEGPITDLHTWNGMLGSTSYDRSMRLWSINNISNVITSVKITYDKWINTFDINPNNSMVWLGTEQGEIPSFCSDIEQNAAITKKKINREFTPKEWNFYIGEDIPQYYFMK